MTHEEITTLLKPLLDAERLWQEGEQELQVAYRKTREAKAKVAKAQEAMRRFARECMEPSIFDAAASS